VVEILDAGALPDGRPYLVLELVRGKTLEQLRLAHRSLPLPQCLAIMNSVCATLEEAHQLGVIHRDVTPANIVLEERGAERPRVRVLDWGAARATGPARPPELVTRAGQLFGTPGYAAPEASLGEPVDGRADVFAAATVLWELAAGRVAFDGSDGFARTHAANQVHPPSLSSLRDDVWPALDELVARGMAKDRRRRPDMRSFRAQLCACLDERAGAHAGAPSAARPDGELPLAARATQAADDRARDDRLRRAIAPDPTRRLGRDGHPARHRRALALVIAAALVAATAVLALRH
jgi:serine/threonine-protein kinase